MLDLNAKIIPWIGLGNIKLYQTLENLKPIISGNDVTIFQYDKFLVRYEIPDAVALFFNLKNKKLFKLVALEKYTGILFDNIKIGMNISQVLKLEPSFEYDDFEEVYVSEKGIFIETDPETDKIIYISVFIKELETDKFTEAKW